MEIKYPNQTYDTQWPRIAATPEFMEKNNLSLSRTPDEIKGEIKKVSGDMFGFGLEVLIDYLSYEDARDILNEKAQAEYDEDPSTWEHTSEPLEACQNFLDYMQFGWMKALDKRGISSGRSIAKLSEFLWVLGREDLKDILQDQDLYNPYGTPALVKVCDDLGIEVPEEVREFSTHPDEEEE